MLSSAQVFAEHSILAIFYSRLPSLLESLHLGREIYLSTREFLRLLELLGKGAICWDPFRMPRQRLTFGNKTDPFYGKKLSPEKVPTYCCCCCWGGPPPFSNFK